MRCDRIFSTYDCEKLKTIENDRLIDDETGREMLCSIKQIMSRSKRVKPKKIKPTVVTMNSQFMLKDLDTGKKEIYTLVYPGEDNSVENSISILSHIGTCVIGCSIGTVINLNSGLNRYLVIEDVLFQPEAHGQYHM
ncbi:MAG: GreA/GreB family elongation factor [Spirochaetota bacterium]